jgi:uncharacterized protein
MSRIKKYGVLMFLLATMWLGVAAQDSQQQPAIFVTALASGDSIVLRWAPSTATAWQLLNKYGYRIERYTVLRETAVLADRPIVIVAPQVKPAAQAAWEREMDRDDYVAITAQAIFGEDFAVDQKNTDVMSMYRKSTENESRYSFALFAADISPRAAQLAGLRFVDRSIRKDEKYLYKIFSLAPEKSMAIAPGSAYVGSADAAALVPPATPRVTTKGNQAMVSWDGYSQQRLYTAYYLEKSVDNAEFRRINRRPMVNTTSLAKPHMIWMDTVPEGAAYRYRLVGVTAFGQESPVSAVADGKARLKLEAQVAIKRAEVINNASVALQWTVDARDENQIKAFVIERSSSANGKYSLVSEVPGHVARTYTDTRPSSTSYYRVGAKGDDEVLYSFPYLVQLEDSIAPGAPVGLVAVADSTGHVALSWKGNAESDLLGYRVFRSNFRNSEYGQVTVSPAKTAEFSDSITLKTLSPYVYYKIAAVDQRFNMSAFSEVIEVKRPDILPPMPPTLKTVKSVEEGVFMQWAPSPSDDVASYRLYRRHATSATWGVVHTWLKADTTVYTDKVGAQHQYEYYLTAIDDAGLESAGSKKFIGRALPVRNHPAIEQIGATADRAAKRVVLTWRYEVASVAKYQVYRSLPGEPLTLYKTVKEAGLMDDGVKINTSYIYKVKAIFRDGSESPLSREVVIQY